MSESPKPPTERRGRGRPRVETQMEQVATRIPVAYYDRLVQVANKRETSVASLIRQLLIVRLP